MSPYLSDRLFQVKEGNFTSPFYDKKAGVPQEPILGPILYTIYTSDLPEVPGTTKATYADDTAILAKNSEPSIPSGMLQKVWMKYLVEQVAR